MQFVVEIRTLSCTFILGHHLTHLTKAIGFVFLTEKSCSAAQSTPHLGAVKHQAGLTAPSLMNARMFELITSAFVVIIPCGNPV
jgi:hypothetical protein